MGHPNEGLHPHTGRPHQHSCLRQMPGSRTTGKAALLVMPVPVLVVVVTGAMPVLVVTDAGGYQCCAGGYLCWLLHFLAGMWRLIGGFFGLHVFL